MAYSKLTGLKKTAKNIGIMFALPAVLYLLENITDIVPDGYLGIMLPIAGGLTYFIKNRLANKNVE